jgi:hypothetical protein
MGKSGADKQIAQKLKKEACGSFSISLETLHRTMIKSIEGD